MKEKEEQKSKRKKRHEMLREEKQIRGDAA